MFEHTGKLVRTVDLEKLHGSVHTNLAVNKGSGGVRDDRFGVQGHGAVLDEVEYLIPIAVRRESLSSEAEAGNLFLSKHILGHDTRGTGHPYGVEARPSNISEFLRVRHGRFQQARRDDSHDASRRLAVGSCRTGIANCRGLDVEGELRQGGLLDRITAHGEMGMRARLHRGIDAARMWTRRTGYETKMSAGP
ncbi:hypothetical protein [Bosea sp. ANAM02]|uniref:hypothetical protein n=1 Tax=Bosea sp. ANAM02 TaxID=2020412 RepID=UPI0015642BB2|nr:hypothetical protein [Bosea sp. ANAM02]